MPWIKNNILRPINQNILVKSFDINLAWSIAATCHWTVALNVSLQLLPDLHGLFHRDKGSMSAAPFNNFAFCVTGNLRLLLKKDFPGQGGRTWDLFGVSFIFSLKSSAYLDQEDHLHDHLCISAPAVPPSIADFQLGPCCYQVPHQSKRCFTWNRCIQHSLSADKLSRA